MAAFKTYERDIVAGALAIITQGIVGGRPYISPHKAARLATATVAAALSPSSLKLFDAIMGAAEEGSADVEKTVSQIIIGVSEQQRRDREAEAKIALAIIVEANK